MKKIMFISAANSIHTVKWVNSLSKKYEVHLVYCRNHAPKSDIIRKDVILHELSFKAPLGYYINCFELKSICKKINPDIINVHYASGYGTLARIAKLPKVLLSIWGSDVYDFPNESNLKKDILKRNVNYAYKLASTSNVMAKQLKKMFPNLKKKIYITPFGVDVDKFRRISSKSSNNCFIVGNIKTLEDKYGIEYLILGFKKFYDRIEVKDVKLYIYGDGSKRDDYISLINKLGMNKNIILKGKIKNSIVPEKLNEFDVFCAASILNSESFGVAVVEAMACEVPVIATNVDGFSEVMINDETGLLIDKCSSDAIAEAIYYLYKNKELREKFAKNARKRVLENYDWNNNVKAMEKIYNEIISEG